LEDSLDTLTSAFVLMTLPYPYMFYHMSGGISSGFKIGEYTIFGPPSLWWLQTREPRAALREEADTANFPLSLAPSPLKETAAAAAAAAAAVREIARHHIASYSAAAAAAVARVRFLVLGMRRPRRLSDEEGEEPSLFSFFIALSQASLSFSLKLLSGGGNMIIIKWGTFLQAASLLLRFTKWKERRLYVRPSFFLHKTV